MPTADNAIHVEGLVDFQRALKNLEEGAQKELRVVLNKAADIVVRRAKPRVPVRSGRAQGSVRATSQQRYAVVSAGGARVPYYGWLDFGGGVGRGDRIRRPFRRQGRYLYPAFYASVNQVEAEVVRGLVELAEKSGLTVG